MTFCIEESFPERRTSLLLWQKMHLPKEVFFALFAGMRKSCQPSFSSMSSTAFVRLITCADNLFPDVFTFKSAFTKNTSELRI